MSAIVLGLYLRTARYYRPSQIVARFRLGVDSLLLRSSGLIRHRYHISALPLTNGRATFFPAGETDYSAAEVDQWNATAHLAEQGTFTLLNHTVDLGRPIDWQASGTTRLWRYNLHYFDYALDLALLSGRLKDRKAAALLGRLFSEWIAANPIRRGVAWHSYPIARRIVNWIQAISLATPEAMFASSEDHAAFLKSLYQQALYLENHLEFDCLGNHLLADAKALAFAGIFFADAAAARWLKIGEELLWNGLQEQILEDGGHYERSPMYHAIVLQDYLEVVLAFQLNQREVPAWVYQRLISMADFLSGITHPDGEIPLFGDSAFGVARSPKDILAAAEVLLDQRGRWPEAAPGSYCGLFALQAFGSQIRSAHTTPKRNSWPDTGYVVLHGSRPSDQMIIDTKPMGPDHIPAHGHCSVFSYELSVAGERLVVDSGVDEYEPGPWRQFWRSTQAHNTAMLDSREQSEIWASFRVGRRSRVLETTVIRNGSCSLFMGTLEGFAQKSSSILHKRFIASIDDFWLVLDEFTGSGRHTIESLVHFHPEATCEVHDGSASVVLNSIKVRLYPYADANDQVTQMSCVRGQESPIQGWYAPQFGKREPNFALNFFRNTTLPARVGYLIAPWESEIRSWDFQCSNIDEVLQPEVRVRSSQRELVERFQDAAQAYPVVIH